MSKRYSRNTRLEMKHFRSGFSVGKTVALLSLQVQAARRNMGLSIEEFAKGAKLSEKFIKGIEDADLNSYLKSDVTDYVAIANFTGLALEVKYHSHNDNVNITNSIHPKPFDEEVDKIDKG